MRHVNIPIFIPHLGCPNQCVFCNQRSISGVEKFDPKSVRVTIENALQTIDENDEVEIAFFGGSFTGIDRSLMIELLEIAYSYIEAGKITSIRCSTRPDYIDDQILYVLKNYGVKTIELGLQSCSDYVLSLTRRGHNFADEIKAGKMIVDAGFSLVGQMMIGLPGSNIDFEIETANFIVETGASAARIYPTVVFKDTPLYDYAVNGAYTPLSIDEAVFRSAKILEIFIKNNVEVIRIGLQASENLSNENYYAGPNHPALGELVIGEFYYNRIACLLEEKQFSKNDKVTVYVSNGSLSKAIGQSGKNKNRLKKKFPFLKFAETDRLSKFEISVEKNYGVK